MNINKYCELCDNLAARYDTDLGMYLCTSDYNSFNGIVEEIAVSPLVHPITG